jgi:hypothetical protein
MAANVITLCGAVVLAVGSGMQALTEIREYREFMEAVGASEFPDIRWELPELAFVVVHVPPWVTLINLPIEFFRWWKRFFRAIRVFSERVESDRAAVRIRAGLARARNWFVVMLGAILVVVASVLEL